jgi:hypothetical protein
VPEAFPAENSPADKDGISAGLFVSREPLVRDMFAAAQVLIGSRCLNII